jgi:hypothetical protein
MRELLDGKYRPVYYLHGEESYYIDKIADFIAEHALPPEQRDFNQTVLFGSDVNASQIADAARRYPMMAERQVVIVKEAQNIKHTDALEKYMKQPMQSTVLVICHKNGKIDGRKREYVKLIREAVDVAAALGMDFDYDQKVAEVKAVCDNSPKGLTSIYNDLKNGRRSEVDTISGSIVRAGEKAGVPTPNHAFMVALIHAMEDRAAGK